MCKDFEETNLSFKVGGRVLMPPVSSSQSRERKHDLWSRGNRLLYTRDGLVDISLVTENIQKMWYVL